jgi:ketosteroid isomerase-like protein
MQDDFPIDSFIKDYTEAFEARDINSVSAFYGSPCLSVRADGSTHVFLDQTEIKNFFSGVVATYSNEGMAKFVVADVVVDPMGKASSRIVCKWSMRRADQSVIREWRQTYIFQRIAADWKIIASVFHI